jgi:uncharacterized Zn finger protein
MSMFEIYLRCNFCDSGRVILYSTVYHDVYAECKSCGSTEEIITEDEFNPLDDI